MAQSPHLPNEIWLQILQHTDLESAFTAKDLWLSLRPASSQLKACVEQHFRTSLLHLFKVFLPITLPSYDQRNPLKGHAIFIPEVDGRDREILWVKLERTEPEHYLTQFLSRWEGMKDPKTGFVKDVVWWEVEFGGRRERLKFKDARVDGDGDGEGEGVKVGIRWMGMLTVLFRS